VSPWLFPGAQPGRPLSADRLGLRLAVYGIDARTARTSLLLDLGAELAPAFLADLLGMHPGTAVRWVRAAGGDWLDMPRPGQGHEPPREQFRERRHCG